MTSPAPSAPPRLWFFLGLAATTCATLAVEILNTRLLSVMTWYHLSFFAVSTAMLGMAAGAVFVYLREAKGAAVDPYQWLSRYSLALAVSVPLSHLVCICVPLTALPSLVYVASFFLVTVAIATPFFLSGVVVTVALTRVHGAIGKTYFVDLFGAALGALLVPVLLGWLDVSSALFATSAIAGVGALAFQATVTASPRAFVPRALLVLVALATAGVNAQTPFGIRVIYPKGQLLLPQKVIYESWSIQGQIAAYRAEHAFHPYWGGPRGSRRFGKANQIPIQIDGAAGTVLTEWDGDRASLDWISYDVTSLAYHLRKGGRVAVIGVGGGRDVLAALWARSDKVVGLDVNAPFLGLLEGRFRDFAKIADQPEVDLVATEARSYLVRSPDRYDVIQMSLIDTWAATSTGAYSLTENGLYTTEAWRSFLGKLAPTGVLTVSRWYAPTRPSETSRLLSLATASLIDSRVEDPSRQIVLVSGGRVATLLVARSPFSEEDLRRIDAVSREAAFEVVVAPDRETPDPLLRRIVASRTLDELDAVAAGQPFDCSPPTDDRPFFFNILRPSQALNWGEIDAGGGVLSGNVLASFVLVLSAVLSALLVAVVIVFPLLRAGLPKGGPSLLAASTYFGLTGLGFMIIQVAFLQRFSTYLGHPLYSIVVVMFSMILWAGFGSLLSGRVGIGSGRVAVVALAVGALTAATALLSPLVLESTEQLSTLAKGAIVVAFVAPVSLLLGMPFPIGARLIGHADRLLTAWMWGVNGAASVLGSVAAVVTSMSLGIRASLLIGASCYVALALPMLALVRRRSAEPAAAERRA